VLSKDDESESNQNKDIPKWEAKIDKKSHLVQQGIEKNKRARGKKKGDAAQER
jgi:hypothetical protein